MYHGMYFSGGRQPGVCGSGCLEGSAMGTRHMPGPPRRLSPSKGDSVRRPLLRRELDVQLLQAAQIEVGHVAQVVLARGEAELLDPVEKGREAPPVFAPGPRGTEPPAR